MPFFMTNYLHYVVSIFNYHSDKKATKGLEEYDKPDQLIVTEEEP